MNFGSDNATGASDAVMNALQQANSGTTAGYGADEWSKRAERRIAETFDCEVKAFFVATGTAANTLALASLVQPWQSILCHAESHIVNDESTAPEFITGGARMIPLAAGHGKLEPADLTRHFATAGTLVPHNAKVGALSVTQSSELGLVYTPDEIAALTQTAQQHDVRIHMDGARFANAVAAIGCSPAELSWQAGVDVLCLGATKCGALAAEAVVFFNHSLAADFEHRRKRTGHLLSKGRLFGAQFEGWLTDDHWLELARHANAMASLLAANLQDLPGVRLAWPTQANELFVVMPKSMQSTLQSAGASFYEWPITGLAAHDSVTDDEVLVRLVTSYQTHPDEIATLIKNAMA